jgi:hypothetical protein
MLPLTDGVYTVNSKVALAYLTLNKTRVAAPNKMFFAEFECKQLGIGKQEYDLLGTMTSNAMVVK